MTIEQFGASIKQKYPAYQKYSDSEIGQSMLAKYPQYQNQITPPAQKTTPGQKVANAVTGISNLAGTTKLGQGLSTVFDKNTQKTVSNISSENLTNQQKIIDSIHAQTDPVKKQRLIEFLKTNFGVNMSSPTAGDINPAFNLSNKEVLGSAAQTALTAASFGSLPTEGASSFGLSKAGTSLTEGAGKTLAKRLIGTGAKNAALGAGVGVAQGLNDNKSFGQTLKQGAVSGAVSGVLGIGAQGLSEFARALTSPQVGEGIVNKSLGVPKNVIKAGKSPAQEIVASGQVNSKRGFLNKAEQTIQTSAKAIKQELEQNNILHKTPPLLDTIRGQLSGVYKDALSGDDIEKIVDNLPISSLRNNSAMTIDRINSLRSVLDNKYLGNKKWLAAAEAVQPERITALKIAANVLRSKVQSEVPATVPHFEQMSKALMTRTILDNELAKPHILTNILEALASTGVGLVHGGLSLQGALGTAGTYGAIKALTSTPSATALAALLRLGGKTISSQPAKAAAGFTKLGTQKVIQSFQ